MNEQAARESSPDSLFSERSEDIPDAPALDRASIPGLYVFPGILPVGSAVSYLTSIGDADVFLGGARDQVMLFSRFASAPLPDYLQSLLCEVRDLIDPHIPNLRETLWAQPLARQIILNLYTPGKGISPHVDLPHRYADGIVGVSLCGGCIMSFTRAGGLVEVYLPPRTVYVLSGEARWEWAHGIAATTTDVVKTGNERVTMLRETRVSVTYRWMKHGADELSESDQA